MISPARPLSLNHAALPSIAPAANRTFACRPEPDLAQVIIDARNGTFPMRTVSISGAPSVLRKRRNVPAAISVGTVEAQGAKEPEQPRKSTAVMSPTQSIDSVSSGSMLDDSAWFNILPEKVQRTHFSLEEQALLSPARSATVLTSSTHLMRGPSTSREPIGGETTPSSFNCSAMVLRMRKESRKLMTPRLSNRTIDAYEPETDHFHHPDTHTIIPSTDSTPSKLRFEKPKLQRAASLLFEAGHRRSPSAFKDSQMSFTDSIGGGRQQPRHSSPTLNSPCQYYQDPDARMKLRTFLASPQKFDEALEHGFPSTHPANQHSEAPKPTRRVARDRTAICDYQNFLKYDKLAFLDDEQSERAHGLDQKNTELFFDAFDDDSEAEKGDDLEYRDQDDTATLSQAESPRTPLYDESLHGTSTELWRTENALLKHHAIVSPAWIGGREMTLRMTLTKPQLRATDEEIYGWQQEMEDDEKDHDEDPLALDLLALEPLPVLPDHAALQFRPDGMSDGCGGGMTRGLWRKLRQRTAFKE